MVAGYSIGGGHVPHMMRDLTIGGGKRHSARPVRKGLLTAAGALSYMARIVGQKKAREIPVPVPPVRCATQALDMGLLTLVARAAI